MNIEDLKTMTTLQVARAAEARIGAARIAYRAGESINTNREIDYAEYYVREIIRRHAATIVNSTREG